MTLNALSPLIESAVKGTVLLALAWVLCRILRQQAAATRHALWVAALLGLLLLPLTSEALARVRLTLAQPVVDGLWLATIPGTSITVRADADPAISWPALAAWVWLAVTTALLAYWGLGVLRVFLLRRRARPSPLQALADECGVELGLSQSVPVLASAALRVPLACGVFRPRILLPADAASWPEDRLRMVLLHELAHVQRRDCLTHVLSRLAVALYWFHPLVWLAAWNAAREREHACDDAVVALTHRPSDYAEHLLAVARLALPGERGLFAAAMAHHSDLEDRLMTILDPHRNRRPAALLAGAALLTLILPLAAMQEATGKPRIAGTLSDAKGPLASVRVTLTEERTGNILAAVTDSAGRYAFNKIPVGAYRLVADVPGGEPVVLQRANAQGDLEFSFHHSIGENGRASTMIENVTGTTPLNRTPVTTAPAGDAPQQIRVGGNVMSAKAANKVRPLYPLLAKQAAIQGTVRLTVVIATDGTVKDLSIVSGHPLLQQSAMEAVQQWRWEPTLLNGNPVEVRTEVDINFTLAP